MALVLACGLSCNDDNPQAAFDHARRTFEHGELPKAQHEAEQCLLRYSNPSWNSKFKALQAESMLWTGLYREVLTLLQSEPEPTEPSVAIKVFALMGTADARLHQFADATRWLDEAERLCSQFSQDPCYDVAIGRGVMANQSGRMDRAEYYFRQSVSSARKSRDSFAEATSDLDLGIVLLNQRHFDEAVDWTETAFRASAANDWQDIAQTAQGNLAWAKYNLGDFENSLTQSLAAVERARKLGSLLTEIYWTTNAGYAHAALGRFSEASGALLKALDLARSLDATEAVYNSYRALAYLSLQVGDLQKAADYAAQALDSAVKSDIAFNQLYPRLVQGQVAARLRDGDAEEKLLAVEHNIDDDLQKNASRAISLKWEVQHSLAQLYQDQNRLPNADIEYRAALATFESARAEVSKMEFQLSFITNGARTYDDYLHFLISQGKTADALRWADFNRRRTLQEGLGQLSTGIKPKKQNQPIQPKLISPPPLDAQAIARRAHGTLLFYSLGEKQSYLWAVTEQKTNLFPLPPAAEINAMAHRYAEDLVGTHPPALAAGGDADKLYRMLIAPAQTMLPLDGKVFIIPDGSLNGLNFETLIATYPKPHYWIEDADIVNASSLRMLAASLAHKKSPSRKLLLVGNAASPDAKFPEIPGAAHQMEIVKEHFPKAESKVIDRERATPAAYQQSDPGQFDYIHFVAHGIASRTSPLDSAIVLSKITPSKDPAQSDAYKLYARDIIPPAKAKPNLKAELVTISACHSSDGRVYSGEGLVGLAWAFLRSGAHNVVAGMWEITEDPTEQLMGRFYDELEHGATPDVALRDAKLALLHGSAYKDAFYWAPFQLYTGS